MRILNDARTQARRELEQVQAQLARLKVDMGRQRLSQERLDSMRAQVRGMDERAQPVPEPRRRVAEPTTVEPEAGPLQVGDAVRVRSFNQVGELVSLPDAKGEVEVELGFIKVRVAAENIERLSKRQAKSGAGSDGDGVRGVSLPSITEREMPDLQLDLRGQRVEAVLPEVDRYLHDAYMAGMPFVRLLHGKGTGALRQAIREQLAHHPLVRGYESAAANDGGEGITVVTLAQS